MVTLALVRPYWLVEYSVRVDDVSARTALTVGEIIS